MHERLSARNCFNGSAQLFKMKVLQLTYRVPYPPTDGGAIGIYSISKGLHENGCDIDLLAINTPKHSQPPAAMAGIANQKDVFVDTSIKPLRLLRNLLFSSIPYNVERFLSKKVTLALHELLQKNTYDYIHVEGAFVAFYIDEIRKYSSAPIVVRGHNIEYVIWQRLALNERNPLKRFFYNNLGSRLKTFEREYYNKADGIAAITPEDRQRLLDMGVTKPIHIVPVGMMLDKYDKIYTELEKENTIFNLSALDWLPNIEGLRWFLEQVWPDLTKRNPAIELHIAGKSTPEWVSNLQKRNVFVHGFVEDAVKFKKSYQLMLVPLLSGGGMRVKIIEGMAAEKCIISTSIGAEGIAYTHLENIVIADSPQEWIAAIEQFLGNDQQRKQVASNAAKLARAEYENKAVTRRYIEFAKELKV